MRRHVLGETAADDGLPQHALDCTGRDGATWDVTRKQVRPLRACAPEVNPENIKQPLAEHHVAILRPLALADMDEHALAVDVRDPKRAGLRDAESRTVGGHQDRAMLD